MGPGTPLIVHQAYGRVGEGDSGGVEIIRYDEMSRSFRTHFFDYHGLMIEEELTVSGREWVWRGRNTRGTCRFSDDGKKLITHHERSDDGTKWISTAHVTLTRVD